MIDEIWKPVPSLPGVVASSWGRILFPERTAKMPNGGIRVYKPKPTYGCVTKAHKNAQHVYMGVYNKFYGNIKVHRAVCEAFHGAAPAGKNLTLHIDENGKNNKPNNLYWGTQKENLNAPRFIEYCKNRTGKNNPYIKGRK